MRRTCPFRRPQDTKRSPRTLSLNPSTSARGLGPAPGTGTSACDPVPGTTGRPTLPAHLPLRSRGKTRHSLNVKVAAFSSPATSDFPFICHGRQVSRPSQTPRPLLGRRPVGRTWILSLPGRSPFGVSYYPPSGPVHSDPTLSRTCLSRICLSPHRCSSGTRDHPRVGLGRVGRRHLCPRSALIVPQESVANRKTILRHKKEKSFFFPSFSTASLFLQERRKIWM